MSPRKKQESAPEVQEAPETTHRFIGGTPLIFTDLHHPDPEVPGSGVFVRRANGEPATDTGLVVLNQGDEVALPLDYEHALLELVHPPQDETPEGDNPADEATSEGDQS